MIDNPEYVFDENVYAYKSAFVGFDLWQVKAGTLFDNIIITDSLDEANEFAEKTWKKDVALEREAKEIFDKEQEEQIEKKKKELNEKEESEHDEL
jgi:calreticulin